VHYVDFKGLVKDIQMGLRVTCSTIEPHWVLLMRCSFGCGTRIPKQKVTKTLETCTLQVFDLQSLKYVILGVL